MLTLCNKNGILKNFAENGIVLHISRVSKMLICLMNFKELSEGQEPWSLFMTALEQLHWNQKQLQWSLNSEAAPMHNAYIFSSVMLKPRHVLKNL